MNSSINIALFGNVMSFVPKLDTIKDIMLNHGNGMISVSFIIDDSKYKKGSQGAIVILDDSWFKHISNWKKYNKDMPLICMGPVHMVEQVKSTFDNIVYLDEESHPFICAVSIARIATKLRTIEEEKYMFGNYHEEVNGHTDAYSFFLIGNEGVGKSSYLNRLNYDELDSKIFDNCTSAEFPFDTNKGDIVIDISNTITRHTKGIIVMFDVTCYDSYWSSMRLIQSIREGRKREAHLPIAWVGNKCDIRDRKVGYEEISRNAIMMIENGSIVSYNDISAKTTSGIYNPLNKLLSTIDVELNIKEENNR